MHIISLGTCTPTSPRFLNHDYKVYKGCCIFYKILFKLNDSKSHVGCGLTSVGMTARTTRVLLMMVVPGQLVFMYVIYYTDGGHVSITPFFITGYLIACLLQVNAQLYCQLVPTVKPSNRIFISMEYSAAS